MNVNKINKIIVSGAESAAQWSIGQAVLRLADKMLWIVEKSVEWSLPVQELNTEENGKSFGKPELTRPLPWLLFLPGLLALTMIRFSFNWSAGILGYPKIEPGQVIRVVQRCRRRLRVIKSSGLKNMRVNKHPVVKDKPMSIKEASKSLVKSIRLTLSSLSCLDSGSKTSPSPPPTKIHVSNYLDSVPSGPHVSEEKISADSSVTSPQQLDYKRKYSEISSDGMSDEESEDEPLISKIDRLANESASDRSYSPDESNESETSDSSESEADMSISLSEVHDVTAEKDEEPEKLWCNDPNCTDILCANELHVKPSNEINKY